MCGKVSVVLVGPITVDGLSTVGPKRVLNWTIKKVASYSLDLVCKGIKFRCAKVLRRLLLFKDVLLRVLYYWVNEIE